MKDETIRELWWELAGYGATAGLCALIALGLWLTVPSLCRRLFPLPRLRPGTWGGHEVFLAFCVLVGTPELVTSTIYLMGFFAPLLGPSPRLEPPDASLRYYLFRCSLVATPLARTVTLAVLFGVLYARSGARPHHYGLTRARWPANLTLGLGAFVVATPVVMGLHVLAMLLLPERPNLIVAVVQAGFHEWEWLFFALQLVVAAPLLEEIVFRGILMGWLRRASLSGHLAVLTMTLGVTATLGVYYYDPTANANLYDPGPLVFAVLLASGYGWQLYRLARRFQLREEEIQAWRPEPGERGEFDEQRDRAWKEANATLAIYGSAMLFAFFHANAWPAPIPLFVMALVLGLLARRTQSLLGPLAFHALFNLTNMIALYVCVTYR